MKEDKEKKVNLDLNRHKGKTLADTRDETFEGIEQVISSDKSLQFTQDKMDMFIQSRKDDPFYNFKEDKIDTTPIVTEDFSMGAPPVVQGVGAGGGTTMYYVRNGTIERIKM